MHKEEFLTRFAEALRTDGASINDSVGRRGYSFLKLEKELLNEILGWLRPCSLADPHSYWLAYLDQFLAEANEAFQHSDKYKDFREWWSKNDQYPLPDLFNCHVGGLPRTLYTHAIAHFMGSVAEGPWLTSRLLEDFNAQQQCIDQAWRTFVRKAYRPYMARVREESHRGNKGVFGNTELLTWAGIGRVMFTFKRGQEFKPGYEQVSFVADDGDPYGYRSGANHSSSPYRTCIDMIEEVTKFWDIDKMQESKSVSFCGM